MSRIRFKKLSIIPPLLIKASSMLLVFFSAYLIIDQIGLSTYGLYSQSLSLLLLFISVSSLGFAQSFIRKSAGLTASEKLEMYNTQHRIVNTNTLFLLPVFALSLHYFLGLGSFSLLVMCVAFILVSTQRIRFSYIRTSSRVRISELPDMVVRHVIFVLLILVMGVESTSDLYPMLTIALLGAYLFQKLLAPELPLLSLKRPMGLRKLKDHVEKNDIKIWLNTSLVQLKEFLEISLVLVAVGTSSGGEYKLLMQFSLAFMAVFNALNVVNSFSYAKIIEKGDIEILNRKAANEMKIGLQFFLLVLASFVTLTYFYDVFARFSLPQSSYQIFFVILIHPFCNLLMGPLVQLNIHYQNMNFLNVAQIVKICLIALIGLYYLFFGRFGLLEFIIWKIVVEIIFIVSLSYVLFKKFDYVPPIMSKLRRHICQK